MGRNQFYRESTLVKPMEATAIVSGITKEVEDLQQLLIQIGTIDEMTDLRLLVQSIGIVISDESLFRSSINMLSLTINETINEIPEQVEQEECNESSPR
jgi:hypothetical protein